MLVKNSWAIMAPVLNWHANPKFFGSRALQKTALQICWLPGQEADYVYDNVLKGSAVPLVVPEWTDENDWAAVCDPRATKAVSWRTLWPGSEIFIMGMNFLRQFSAMKRTPDSKSSITWRSGPMTSNLFKNNVALS